MATLAELLKDKRFREDVGSNARDFLQSASNAAANQATIPIDAISWLLRKGGVPIPEAPVFSSQWAKNAGLMAEPKDPKSLASLLGDAAGNIAPMVGYAKAPEIARGLLKADEALKPVAGRMVDKYMDKIGGKQNIFMGESSKTWNAADANKAKEMLKAGADPRKVWQETGTWKAPDGMLRQEIDDSASSFKKDFVNQFNNFGARKEGSVFNHPDLYNAYPETKNIVTMRNSLDDWDTLGTFDGKNITLEIPRKAANSEQIKSTNLHELQHAIQQQEGFAKGGSPSEFTQQDVALKARDMLSWQREVASKLKQNPSFDWHAAEKAAAKEYQSIGWPEAVPSPEVRKMAINPMEYFGSQPEEFVKLYGLDKRTTPYTSNELYKRLAGEAEARATQARMPLNSAQRRALFPEDSYDVPLKDLIVRNKP